MYRIYTVILFEDLRYITREESRYTGERIYESSSDWNGNRDDRACSWNNFLFLTNLVATTTCGGNAFKCSFVCLYSAIESSIVRFIVRLLCPRNSDTQVIVSHAHAHALTHATHTPYVHACIHTYIHSRNNTSHGLTSLCG